MNGEPVAATYQAKPLVFNVIRPDAERKIGRAHMAPQGFPLAARAAQAFPASQGERDPRVKTCCST
jgi:hypothetical protein